MWNLAQSSSYYTTSSNSGGIGIVLILIYLALIVVFFVAAWKIFVKAHQDGWKALIPIYNTVIMCRIVGISGWYVLLLIVPLVNLIFAIYLAYKMAQCFGYGIGMTILELLGVGYLILGFGSAKYLGPSAKSTPKSQPAAA